MNKQELIAKITEKSELSQANASKYLNAFIETVKETLAEGEKVTLIGFGTFSVSERPARKGRNPQTGEAIDIPATNVPKFKPGAELKESVKK